eukprot:6062460-Pleurochrysis_carterae.AAC.1
MSAVEAPCRCAHPRSSLRTSRRTKAFRKGRSWLKLLECARARACVRRQRRGGQQCGAPPRCARRASSSGAGCHFLLAEGGQVHVLALQHVRAVADELDGGVRAVVEVGQELGREQKVLLAAILAGLHDARKDVSLVGRVHGLVDLVDNAKRRRVDDLERDEVDHGGDGALATR